MFSDQEIQADCFPAFTQETWQVFDLLETDKAYIWSVGGINDNGTDTPFLVKNGISGFLLPDKITMPMESISSKAKLTFTGRVYKKWPSWGEYYIGGSRKNIQLEVTVEGNNYLVFDPYIPRHLKEKLSKKCTFD